MRSRGRKGWFLNVGAALALLGAIGCGEDRAIPVVHHRVTVPPVEPERGMRPLSVAPDADPAPETRMVPADNVTLDARLLVITGDGSDSGLDAITQALRYLGTPYDLLDASRGPTLTADMLAAGDHGRYYGIVLDTGDLAVGSTSAFSDAEWMVLASYEARFGVRRAVMYAHPAAAYGLQLTGGFDAKEKPIAVRCTAAGSGVFVGANCAVPIAIDDGWAYGGQPSDAFTLPLLVDAAGSAYAATRSYADGREALVLTFSQSPSAMHTLGLVYGVVSWVTRGLFVGERHAYASPQIDDLFLASAIYPTGTYRCTAADLQAFSNWQNARRADPLTARFRSAFAFNGDGAKAPGLDPLTDKARELAPAFAWINHTWAHLNMNAMSYADAYQALSQNNQYALGNGLSPFSIENLVTPEISGLDNAEVMRAAYDVGVRQHVSDTSVTGQANPSPNAGYYNARVPALLALPRRPAELYYNVSLPAEWAAEYDVLHSSILGYEPILAAASDALARHLLQGENDPWMFHQANIRDVGGGQSLLSSLLGATLDKYAARATFPVLSPTMDELARIVKERMALDASAVSATLEPGAKLTVRVTNAATVPVTGLCTPGAESYAGQQISYLRLAAGQSITLSLANCNAGGGGGAAGGASGAGSMGAGGGDRGGAGGSTGTSGHAGSTGDWGARGAPSGGLGNFGSTSPTPVSSGCSFFSSGGGGPGGAGAVALLIAMVVVVVARRRRYHAS